MLLTVSQILRMTLAASGLSRREVALRADLRPSRLERILGGYVAPSRDEFTLIARACGQAHGLVTTPWPARGLPAGTVFGLLLSEPHANGPIDTNACKLSADYLSVSFDADAELLAIVRVTGRPAGRKHPSYRWEYYCGVGAKHHSDVLVQHGVLQSDGRSALRHRRRNSRIEFFPEHASREAWSTVRRVLAIASRVRVTRLDIAVDLPARFQLLADSRKVRIIAGPRGVETLYVGVRKSDRQIRVYDKRRQLIESSRAGEDHPEETRVEAQLRNLKAGVSGLVGLPDPFDGVSLVELSASGLPFPLVLCASYAAAFGAQALRPLIEPSEFATIVRQLAPGDLAHPSHVYAEHWPRVGGDLLRRLGLGIQADGVTAAKGST